MAVDYAPVRHRKATVPEQNLRVELSVLHGETREMVRHLLPSARRLHAYVTVVGGPEQDAAKVIYLLERAQRRLDGGDAA